MIDQRGAKKRILLSVPPQPALNESPNSNRNSSLSSEESHPHVTI
jgi:hypothetical protein